MTSFAGIGEFEKACWACALCMLCIFQVKWLGIVMFKYMGMAWVLVPAFQLRMVMVKADWGGGVLARRAHAECAPGIFFLPFPTRACFCPPSPNNLEYLLAVSKNLARPLYPVYDHGKGGGWKWWV